MNQDPERFFSGGEGEGEAEITPPEKPTAEVEPEVVIRRVAQKRFERYGSESRTAITDVLRRFAKPDGSRQIDIFFDEWSRLLEQERGKDK